MSGRLITPILYHSRPDPIWPTDHKSRMRIIPGGFAFATYRRKNNFLAGDGVVSGTVTISGVGGVSRKVLLFERKTGKLIDSVWSAADGSYSFEGHDKDSEYLVVAIDHTKAYNAARADAVVPE